MRDIRTMSKEERQSALVAWNIGAEIVRNLNDKYSSPYHDPTYDAARSEWERLTGEFRICDTAFGE